MRSVRTTIRRASAALAVIALLAPTAPAPAAAAFNPHRIIGDDEIRAADAMSFPEIVAFLSRKGRLNEAYDIDPADGLLKGAAQLIDDAAKRYRVNPKYLLALIQKESSAVESGSLTQRQLDWATGYALCDGCYRTSPLAQKYKGLGKQIDAGAGYIDWYFKTAQEGSVPRLPGKPYKVSGTTVTPANLATAALYTYTPHLHGNRLLWSILNRWFGSGDTDLGYPDGTLLRNARSGAVALMQNGKLRPILNSSVLATRFNASAVIDIDEFEFKALESSVPGRPVRFADLSLVRTEDGTTYLLTGANKRKIASQEVFARIGFNPEEVEDAAAADLEEYGDAAPITLDSAFPLGELLQDRATGGVYYAEAGVKHPLWDRALLAANFAGRSITPAAKETLAALTLGEPVRFADGTLVKAPDEPKVYVISGGARRPIADEGTFLLIGYKFENVLTASRKMLELHPLGEVLNLTDAE